MPVFTIQAPDGRHLDIEATDQDTAIRGAQQWVSANPANSAPQTAPARPVAKPTGFAGWLESTGIAPEARKADQAYRADMANLSAKAKAGKSASPLEILAPVGDAMSAAMSPIMGPLHKQFGQTGGDIISFAVPLAGEVNAAREVNVLAKTAGVSARSMGNALQASRAGQAAAPAAQAPNALAQTVEKFDKADVRPSLAATGDGAAKWANSIAENALAGGAARRNMAGQVQDVQRKAASISKDYGNAADRTATGEAVQQGVKDFNQRFSDRAEALYDPVFAKIGTAQEIASQQANNVASLRNAQGAGTVKATPVIQPTATAQLLSEINGRGSSPALRDLFSTPQVQKLTAAVQDPASLSFGDLRAARTWVREAQKPGNETLRQGVSHADLQRIEGALTQDINSNAASIAGQKVARQLQQADQFYRLGSQRIQGALQAFVGKGGEATAESAYDRVIRAAGDKGGADTARLVALKKSLRPNEWGDVAASVIDRMGAPSKGAADANEAGAFSLNNFVSNYAGLSDRGKAVLFGGGDKGANLKAELDNLASVAGQVKAVEKGANASKSGVSVQNAGTLTTLGGAVTAAALGHIVPLAVELGGLASMNVTGRMLTDPRAVRWLANLGKAQKVGPQATASAVSRLGTAARTTPALVPLYQESLKLLPQKAAADATSQEQPTQ